jgi:1,4-dihydroxy-2-naphthoate octaprenyltransferase
VYDQLKRVPSGDSIAVGATWAYIGVFAVVLSTGYDFSFLVVASFVGWFLVVFAGVESRNIADASGDTDARKTTLAGHLGPRLARTLELLVKLAGVVVFWALLGTTTAVLAVGYLLLLRSFRLLTRQAGTLLHE